MRFCGRGHRGSRDVFSGGWLKQMHLQECWKLITESQTLRLLSSIERDLLPIKVLHCGNREFRAFFAPVTLTLAR